MRKFALPAVAAALAFVAAPAQAQIVIGGSPSPGYYGGYAPGSGGITLGNGAVTINGGSLLGQAIGGTVGYPAYSSGYGTVSPYGSFGGYPSYGAAQPHYGSGYGTRSYYGGGSSYGGRNYGGRR